MRSIVDEVFRYHNVIGESNMSFLLLEAPTISSVNGEAAKAMGELVAAMVGFPKTLVLMKAAVGKLKDSVTSAAGEDEEAKAEGQATFILANDFGSAMTRFMNATMEAIALEEHGEDDTVSTALGGTAGLQKTIEKFFIPTPGAHQKISKAIEKLTAGAKTGAENIKTSVTGKTAAAESDESIGRGRGNGGAENVDEGIFGDIGNFIKDIFKSAPKDAKTTIKNLEKLFGGNIAKSLATDLDKMKVSVFKEAGTAMEPALKKLNPDKTAIAPEFKEKEKPEAGATSGGTAVLADNPAVVKSVTAAVTNTLGDSAAKLVAALEDISSGGDPKAAASGLDAEAKKMLQALLTQLGKDGKNVKPEELVDAAAETAGITPEPEADAELKYKKYIDVEKIKKVAGDKGPSAVDKLLAGDDKLRKKLGISDSYKRLNHLVNNKKSMYSLMFEKVDPEIIDALKKGLDKSKIDKDLKDEEAAEIAQSIIDKIAPGKKDDEKKEDLSTLSSALFRSENPDKPDSKKVVRDVVRGSKGYDIKTQLDRISKAGSKGSWPDVQAEPTKNRKEFITNIQNLKKQLDSIKIESTESEGDLIMERWQRLAGLRG